MRADPGIDRDDLFPERLEEGGALLEGRERSLRGLLGTIESLDRSCGGPARLFQLGRAEFGWQFRDGLFAHGARLADMQRCSQLGVRVAVLRVLQHRLRLLDGRPRRNERVLGGCRGGRVLRADNFALLDPRRDRGAFGVGDGRSPQVVERRLRVARGLRFDRRALRPRRRRPRRVRPRRARSSIC